MPFENVLAATPASKHRYTTLDGMRGVAAFAVMCFHCPFFFHSPKSGYLAVDFFFALSGFVLVKSYDNLLLKGLSAFQFLKLRIARLYPMYILAILLNIAATSLIVSKHIASPNLCPTCFFWTWKYFLELSFVSVLMLPDPTNTGLGLYPLLFPAWSLFYELFANYLFALSRPYLNLKRLKTAITLTGISLVVFVLLTGGADAGCARNDFWGGTNRVLFSFGIGCYIAYHPPKLIPRSPALLLIGLLTLAFFCQPFGYLRVTFDLFFIVIISPLLIILGSANEPRSRFLNRFFGALGTVSYPIYIFAAFFFQKLDRVFETFLPTASQLLISFSGLLGACILSLVFLWLEQIYDRPARKILLCAFNLDHLESKFTEQHDV